MFECYSEGIRWLCFAVGGNLLVWFGSTCPLRGKSHCNIVLTDHLNPMMKHLYPDGNGVLQDDNARGH